VRDTHKYVLDMRTRLSVRVCARGEGVSVSESERVPSRMRDVWKAFCAFISSSISIFWGFAVPTSSLLLTLILYSLASASSSPFHPPFALRRSFLFHYLDTPPYHHHTHLDLEVP